MEQPIVIDNFLQEIYQKSISDLLTGVEFPWNFHRYSVSNEPLDKYWHTEEPHKEHIQFRHIFADDNVVKSEFFQYVKPLLVAFEMQYGKKVKGFRRLKSNLLMPQKGPSAQQPHIDGMAVINETYDAVGKKTLLYYVNDSDGDTVLYNEYFTEKPLGRLTKQQTVPPKKGRAVIFDSNQLHAGCCPTNSDYRIILNFVLEI